MQLAAHAAVTIAASRRTVWRALLAPETIVRIMPVTQVIAGWQLGEPFVWAFELDGKASRVQGFVRRIEDEHEIEYEYEDPHARDVHGVTNVHRVVITLTEGESGTLVEVLQDANQSAAALAHAEGGWRLALNNLKAYLEAS